MLASTNNCICKINVKNLHLNFQMIQIDIVDWKTNNNNNKMENRILYYSQITKSHREHKFTYNVPHWFNFGFEMLKVSVWRLLWKQAKHTHMVNSKHKLSGYLVFYFQKFQTGYTPYFWNQFVPMHGKTKTHIKFSTF